MALSETLEIQSATDLPRGVDWREYAMCSGRLELFFAKKAERPQARARREARADGLRRGLGSFTMGKPALRPSPAAGACHVGSVPKGSFFLSFWKNMDQEPSPSARRGGWRPHWRQNACSSAGER